MTKQPRRIPLLQLAGLTIILLAAIVAIAVSREVRHANRDVERSVRVQVAVTELSERLSAHESAMRGYVNHPEPSIWNDLQSAQRGVHSRLAMLHDETRGNALQTQEFDRLAPLIGARLKYSEQRVAERDRAAGPLGFGIRQVQARYLARLIHRQTRHMFDIEQRALDQSQRRMEWLTEALSIGLVGTVILVVVVAYLMIGDARRQNEALRLAHEDARAAEGATRLQMTAREEVEGQLRQIQKMESIGQLTGGIAHDFNNMLAVIIGSLDLAKRHRHNPDRVARHLDSALGGADRAGALVARLLAFSRRQPLAPEIMDVNALVGGMTELLARTLGERIAIRTDFAPHLWWSYADPIQLENAILNLAVNARDAMDGGGVLVIGAANAAVDDAFARNQPDLSAGDYVVISVADDGPGMSEEVRQRAFDPFFTTKGVGKGTGLGLSQVFGFAKQSGGHVEIESSTGFGTVVRLYLPRHDPPVLPLPAHVPVRSAPAPTTGEVILVVEDDPRVRQFSMEALSELGYTPVAAPDSTAAIDLAVNRHDLALVFTDVVMPGMTGPELGQALRKLRPDIKLLYTTGYARDSASQEGLLTADMAVLPKPFTLSQLASKVREAIEGG